MPSIKTHSMANYAKALKDLIKITEKFYQTVYMDGGGVTTVGYGFALAVFDGTNWVENPENIILPTALSTVQIAELTAAIGNLNAHGTSVETKLLNDTVTQNLKVYSVSEPQANTMLPSSTVKRASY